MSSVPLSAALPEICTCPKLLELLMPQTSVPLDGLNPEFSAITPCSAAIVPWLRKDPAVTEMVPPLTSAESVPSLINETFCAPPSVPFWPSIVIFVPIVNVMLAASRYNSL